MSSIAIKLRPITVPNYIIPMSTKTGLKQDGIDINVLVYSVEELSRETLIELADEFKFNLLKKAGYE